jgi:catechol 2,3-dioxygenase-like lactoylglutathione lyase family enzyme
MDFALIPPNVPAAIGEARARGLELSGPIDGSRLRPDGCEIRWRTARQSTFDLPFLCGDVTDRDLRVPPGDARRHANGATGIKTLTISVRDLQRSLGAYEALLGRHLAGPSVPVGETQLLLEQAPQRREGSLRDAHPLDARQHAPRFQTHPRCRDPAVRRLIPSARGGEERLHPLVHVVAADRAA